MTTDTERLVERVRALGYMIDTDEGAQTLSDVIAALSQQGRDASMEALVPAGWAFEQADFSYVASGRIGGRGRVMLVRDVAGKAWWLSLDEEGQEREALYAFGYGTTLADAFTDAARQAALATQPKERS